MSLTPEEERQAAHEHVAELIAAIDPGTMLTRTVVIAEVIAGDDGRRCQWVLASPGTLAHDALGLLDYARLVQEDNVRRTFTPTEDD